MIPIIDLFLTHDDRAFEIFLEVCIMVTMNKKTSLKENIKMLIGFRLQS
jgi:hypothetical protein